MTSAEFGNSKRTNGDGGPFNSTPPHKVAAEGQEDSLDRREIGSAFPGSIEHQELLLEQEILGDE